MTVKAKLVLSVTGTLVASFLLTMLILSRLIQGLVGENFHEAQKSRVRELAALTEQGLAMKDRLFLLDHYRLLRTDLAVNYAYAFDARGRVFAHTDREFVGKAASVWASSGRDAGAVEWESPGRAAGGPFTVRIGFSKTQSELARRASLRRILTPVAVIALAGTLLSLVIGISLSLYLSRAIEGLSRAARAIGSGDLSYEAAVGSASNDEIGRLAGEMNEMTRKLKALDELKDEFISSVSHDLRSPIAAIKTYLEFILHVDPDRGSVNPRHREWLEIAVDNAARLNVFIANVLDAAKMKAGRMEFKREPVSVRETAADVENLFRVMASSQKVELKTAVEEEVSDVLADPESLRQVVTNLVSNALKFTPEGGTVTIGARHSENGKVEVFVEDTGMGISKEDQGRLFKRFNQLADQPSQSRIKGTGLGLYIVKEMVEAMGGAVAVRSEKGRGSRFSLTLRSA